MTEKEFENLKSGDKVWIFLGKPKKTFVIAKQKDIGSGLLCVQVDDGGFHPTYVAEYVFLTKSEVWEHQIKIKEELVGRLENQKAGEERLLDQYKTELAKAKEEENQPSWFVDFDSGEVFLTWIQDGDDTRNVFPTKQEAYEALAEHYKGKYEEALKTAGKISWVITSRQKVAAIFNGVVGKLGSGMDVLDGEDYDGNGVLYINTQIFASRQEAEAQLKREKDGD